MKIIDDSAVTSAGKPVVQQIVLRVGDCVGCGTEVMCSGVHGCTRPDPLSEEGAKELNSQGGWPVCMKRRQPAFVS